MTSVNELFIVTKELYEHLEIPLPKEDREEFIEGLQQLLNKREELLKKFSRDIVTEDEKKMARLMVEWNKQIQFKLTNISLIIKGDISNLKKQKDTSRRYENPYLHDPIDGVFFDKKK